MSTYTAQQLLDQLHASGYSELFDPTLPDKVYVAKLKLFRQVLRQIKKSLKAEQAEIRSRWNGRKALEAQQEKMQLLPYQVIEQVIDKIDISIAELEVTTATHAMPPLPFTFEDMIVTDSDGKTFTAELVNRAAYTQAKLEREERGRVALAEQEQRQQQERVEYERQEALRRRVVAQRQAEENLRRTQKAKRRRIVLALGVIVAIVLCISGAVAVMSPLGTTGQRLSIPTLNDDVTRAAMVAPTWTQQQLIKHNETSTLTLTPTIADTVTVALTDTLSPTDIPSSPVPTETDIPTPSAKAEQQRIALLRSRYKGISGLLVVGNIRAYPSVDKQQFTVTVEVLVSLAADVVAITDVIRQRTITALGFTPTSITVSLYDGYIDYVFDGTGERGGEIDSSPSDSILNLARIATSRAPKPTQYIPPTAYVYDYPTLDYSSMSYPTLSYSGSGGSTCADGTHSSSTGRGTCSHHGGVAH